jgi:hypothetical protein
MIIIRPGVLSDILTVKAIADVAVIRIMTSTNNASTRTVN